MTKAEAYKVLRVASNADYEIVAEAYRHLVRKHQGGSPADRKHLDQINEAGSVLQLDVADEPLADEATYPTVESKLASGLADATLRQMRETSIRWRGRVPEVAVFTVASAMLAVLALGAGASPIATLLTLLAAFVAIWAPWRGVDA